MNFNGVHLQLSIDQHFQVVMNVKTERDSSNRSQVFEVAGACALQYQDTHSRSITRHATSFSSAIILADLTSSLQMKERSKLSPQLETKSLFCVNSHPPAKPSKDHSVFK